MSDAVNRVRAKIAERAALIGQVLGESAIPPDTLSATTLISVGLAFLAHEGNDEAQLMMVCKSLVHHAVELEKTSGPDGTIPPEA